MASEKLRPDVEDLSASACWALLREADIGRLAVWVDDHPDIFPINYAIDHGSIVFRSSSGTKVAAALSDAPVAFEVDGFDTDRREAWSVVAKGDAQEIRQIQDLVETIDLPLFPWQSGEKGRFIRIIPIIISGRRFPIAEPSIWRTSLSDVKRSPID